MGNPEASAPAAPVELTVREKLLAVLEKSGISSKPVFTQEDIDKLVDGLLEVMQPPTEPVVTPTEGE